MSDYKVIETGNARLLYTTSNGWGEDWENQIVLIEDFLEEHPKLNEANFNYYLYFFCFPWEDQFLEEECWVGKEIIGFVELEEEDDYLHVHDLDRCTVYSFELDDNQIAAMNSDQMGDFIEKAYETLQNKNIQVADTWRIKISIEYGVKNDLKLKMFYEFFQEES
ncbi:MAG: hypothetical protein U0T83_03840 [Bacteriovoracaceae bacterium]